MTTKCYSMHDWQEWPAFGRLGLCKWNMGWFSFCALRDLRVPAEQKMPRQTPLIIGD